MEKITSGRLTLVAKSLQKFFLLHPEDQAWLFPLLGRAERRAILIMEALEGTYKSYEELGKDVGIHPSTAKQILYALSNGGVNFEVTKTGKWSVPVRTGRRKKLIKIASAYDFKEEND
jgi:hypothetical protein